MEALRTQVGEQDRIMSDLKRQAGRVRGAEKVRGLPALRLHAAGSSNLAEHLCAFQPSGAGFNVENLAALRARRHWEVRLTEEVRLDRCG